ncbi:MAG: hypothetical protein ACOC4M_12110 [Promethearchaeia archaeon]
MGGRVQREIDDGHLRERLVRPVLIGHCARDLLASVASEAIKMIHLGCRVDKLHRILMD